jgi:asparagine synthase (glutamine-hydrolysing)
MCGIAGWVHRDPACLASETLLLAMRDSLAHRGPDDAGVYLGPGVGLASRRLAILDLSPRGHMPMSSPDGRYQIVYNGEVYNYRDLRAPLETQGVRFRSNTDTEVLLALYAAEGPSMLSKLNGMFALAIYDTQTRTLFLARDRLGIKPLYYRAAADVLWFASEQKALFAAGIPAEFDPEVWEELLCFRYVAGARTPFRGVQRLLPGHYMIWQAGQGRLHRWWHLGQRIEDLRAGRPDDGRSWFRATYDDAVNRRRISDVPVGVLLSGGLDSSSVAASLALQAGSGVASFTVRFDEPDFDEGPLARQLADQWGLEYHELKVSHAEILPHLREASYLNDEPLAHGNDLYLLAISRYARPRVTVLLSGEGADETQGGYVRYRPLRFPRSLALGRWLVPPRLAAGHLRGRLQKLVRFLQLGSVDRFVLFNAADVLPADLARLGCPPTGEFPYREQVLQEAQTVYPGAPLRQLMYLDQHTFLCSLLDRNDRMTMGASIECRVPFLDYRLAEGLGALPTAELVSPTRGKRLLRRAVGDRLPRAILQGRKWGFGVPWRRYLRETPELRHLVESLANVEPIRSGPFERAALRSLSAEFLRGCDQHEALIKQLLMVAVWHQAYLQPRRWSQEAVVTS